MCCILHIDVTHTWWHLSFHNLVDVSFWFGRITAHKILNLNHRLWDLLRKVVCLVSSNVSLLLPIEASSSPYTSQLGSWGGQHTPGVGGTSFSSLHNFNPPFQTPFHQTPAHTSISSNLVDPVWLVGLNGPKLSNFDKIYQIGVFHDGQSNAYETKNLFWVQQICIVGTGRGEDWVIGSDKLWQKILAKSENDQEKSGIFFQANQKH